MFAASVFVFLLSSLSHGLFDVNELPIYEKCMNEKFCNGGQFLFQNKSLKIQTQSLDSTFYYNADLKDDIALD